MKIGIIICNRYRSCEGGKCFRAVNNRKGAFKRYAKDKSLELVSYTTCGGCPGGNVENTVSGMKKYGAEAIHFATGVLAGYPPCRNIKALKKYIEEETGLLVIVGTHPMPSNYIQMHEKLNDWSETHKKWLKEFQLKDPDETVKYNSTLSNYGDKLQREVY